MVIEILFSIFNFSAPIRSLYHSLYQLPAGGAHASVFYFFALSTLLPPSSALALRSRCARPSQLLAPARSARQGRIPPAAHWPLLTPRSAELECSSERAPVSRRAGTRTQLRRRGAGSHPGGGARPCQRAATRVVAQRLGLPGWGKRQLLCSMRPGSGWFLLFNQLVSTATGD